MKPTLVTHTPRVVVGLPIVTQPMSPEIPALWSRFLQRAQDISPVLEPGVAYGVIQMNVGAGGELSYLAGLPVACPAGPAPAGMAAVTLAAGLYAVFEFAVSETGAAFDFILNTWLPSSGYAQAASPLFERYGEDFDPNQPSSRMEVHVPLMARSGDSRSAPR